MVNLYFIFVDNLLNYQSLCRDRLENIVYLTFTVIFYKLFNEYILMIVIWSVRKFYRLEFDLSSLKNQ